MRIKVDPDACQGHGLCAMYAEELFAIRDEDGRASVRLNPVPDALQAAARQVVAVCPELAITVEEEV